jgi:hypothetical protein
MKRNIELVREILIEIDAYDGSADEVFNLAIAGHSYEEVTYHVVLLAEAGLINAEPDGINHSIARLTWQGHEFLDAARSEEIWDAAKKFALKTTRTMTLESIKLAIPHVMKLLMRT